MAKAYDATTRDLIELDPVAWLKFLHIQVPDPGRVRVIDSDVSAITAEADKVLRIDDQPPWVVHVELQSRRDARMADRLHRYNALLSYRHELPVHSVVVLLRPEAEMPALSGLLEKTLPKRTGAYLQFRYDIIRVWQFPVRELLAGGLATLPLAPISDVKPEELTHVLRTLLERLHKEAPPHQEAMLWTSTEVLLNSRYGNDRSDEILSGVQDMILGIHGIEETAVYQRIFAKGRVHQAREILLRQGRKKFGPPEERIQAAIEVLSDADRLDLLTERILDVSSWEELLAPLEPSNSDKPE
jgi:predicted transposase YdaD